MQEMVQVEEEVMVLMEAKDHHMVVVAAVVVVEWVEPRKTLVPIYKPPTGTVSN